MEKTQTEVKKRNTNRISVIEYKDQLFRTDEELKAYKQIELMTLFECVTYTPEQAVALIDGLIDNVVTTKQKLIDFRDAFIAEKMQSDTCADKDGVEDCTAVEPIESVESTEKTEEEDEQSDKF